VDRGHRGQQAAHPGQLRLPHQFRPLQRPLWHGLAAPAGGGLPAPLPQPQRGDLRANRGARGATLGAGLPQRGSDLARGRHRAVFAGAPRRGLAPCLGPTPGRAGGDQRRPPGAGEEPRPCDARLRSDPPPAPGRAHGPGRRRPPACGAGARPPRCRLRRHASRRGPRRALRVGRSVPVPQSHRDLRQRHPRGDGERRVPGGLRLRRRRRGDPRPRQRCQRGLWRRRGLHRACRTDGRGRCAARGGSTGSG